MFERRLYFHLDWPLIAALIMLCGMGVAMIYSATINPRTQLPGPQFFTQLSAIAIGVVALLVCVAIDYRVFARSSLLMYAALLAILVYVLVAGSMGGGARRWIQLGVFNLQPSEFAKVVLALVLAMVFAEHGIVVRTTSDVLLGAAFLLVPLFLIARQPDLGTAVTLLPVYVGIAFVAGLRMKILGILALIALLAMPVVWKYGLEDYQRSRISTFLDPSKDPRGAGYQQIQARITVGSGGLTGKGYLQGTQGQYKFLPVGHTDFIFSVLAEELGFLGVLTALGLYLFVMFRMLEAARLAKDRLGTYLVVGLFSGFAFQVIYNITMSAGLAPVKGLTLPLMSYGGSSMVATLAACGLILNVRMRRFTN